MMPSRSYLNSRVLKLNVGFIVAEGPGFSREISLDIPEPIRLAEDLTIENLSGVLRLTRTSEGILLQGQLQCTFPDECSRCLDELFSTVTLDLEEIFAVSYRDDNDPFVIGEDGILDLAPLVREETILNAPQHVLCRPDCRGLCPICGQNLNEGACDCEPDEIDPRWSALADLLTKQDRE